MRVPAQIIQIKCGPGLRVLRAELNCGGSMTQGKESALNASNAELLHWQTIPIFIPLCLKFS